MLNLTYLREITKKTKQIERMFYVIITFQQINKTFHNFFELIFYHSSKHLISFTFLGKTVLKRLTKQKNKNKHLQHL